MKYRIYNNNLVLVNTRDKSLWHFYYSYPDSVSLGELMFGTEFNEKAINKSLELGLDFLKQINKHIEKTGIGNKANLKSMISILSEIYGITREEVEDKIGYNRLALETCLSLNCSDFEKQFQYDEYKRLLKYWDNDIERVKKYIERVVIPDSNMNVLVDIWDTEEERKRPTRDTERFLLYHFHNHWGDELDGFIQEAVEKYPDPKDYDKAYYFVSDKYKEKQEKIRKEIEERNETN